MASGTRAGHIQLFAPAPGSPVRWRLLSGNNREAGRAAVGYRNEEQCRSAVRALQAQVERMESSVKRIGPQHWAWELRLAGVVVATSSMEYAREIRCSQAMENFLESFGRAAVAEGVLYSDSRRWASSSSLPEQRNSPRRLEAR